MLVFNRGLIRIAFLKKKRNDKDCIFEKKKEEGNSLHLVNLERFLDI